MGFTLILSEKRETAERIAKALDDEGKPEQYYEKGIPYYECANRGQMLRVVPAVGHLYTIAPSERGAKIPILDVEWVPAYRFNRRLTYTKTWIEAIQKISEDASDFVSATDYDVEGEVIGYTVLHFACGGKEKEAKRMVFSTLTKTDLQQAFRNLSPTIDFKLAEAGETRHIVDFLWGINISRALTLSLSKVGGGFSKLSSGRVQGPTLGFIAEREKEIKSFVPSPFWRISATMSVDGQTYRVEYSTQRISTMKEAQEIVSRCASKEGTVKEYSSRISEELPPPPFNLENLQSESYRLFRNSPSQTLRMAETLYLGAMISYPRTSSEKLPPALDLEDIITAIARSPKYGELANELLRNRLLRPREGRGEDPAHPAIYPTGIRPESLGTRQAKLLDLVTRRFLSSFAPSAKIENKRVMLDLNREIFYLTGRRILNHGWLKFYHPYVRTEETTIPSFEEGQKVVFKDVSYVEMLTAPPPRYNAGSILRKMEEYGLGTKATRAGIIDTLSFRHYISGEYFEATNLGLAVHDTLSKFCPVLVSVDFTRSLENKMEAIWTGQAEKKEVISEAIAGLSSIMTDFNKNEYAIGESLSIALRASNSKMRTIGSCPICKKGNLQIVRSKRTGKIFAGCSNYEEDNCRATYPLPQPPYRIWTTRKLCRKCGWPTITVVSPGRGRPWNLCLNPNCPTKEGGRKNQPLEISSSQSDKRSSAE